MLITTHPSASKAVKTPEGFEVPTDFVVEVQGAPEWDFDLELVGRYDVEAGQYVADTLTMTPEITGERLRRVKVGELLHGAAVEATSGCVPPTEELRRLRPDGPTDRVLELVARVYRIAVICRLKPTQDVASAFGVPRQTAARWVQLARQRGFLRPTEPGVAGERDAVVVPTTVAGSVGIPTSTVVATRTARKRKGKRS